MVALRVAVLVILVGFALLGYRKGLVRTAVSLFSIILVMVIASAVNPTITRILKEDTKVYQSVKDACEKTIREKVEQRIDDEKAQLAEKGQGALDDEKLQESLKGISLPEGLGLPDVLAGAVDDAVESAQNVNLYDMLHLDDAVDRAAASLAQTIVRAIAYVLSFVVALIVIRILLVVLKVFTKLPVIRTADHIGGFFLGLFKGLLLVWLLFLIITIFYSTSSGAALMQEIGDDALMSWIYDHNFLIWAATKLI